MRSEYVYNSEKDARMGHEIKQWETKLDAILDARRAINKKPLLMPSCRWPVCQDSCRPCLALSLKLTFTLLCLKTRQSVCCLLESKVSSIWLIIYMTFRKSGSDLLSSFCPLWLFLPPSPLWLSTKNLSHQVHQLYSGWKEFIFHLLLYITLLLRDTAGSINILLHWCRYEKSLNYCRNFSPLASPLTLRSDEARMMN